MPKPKKEEAGACFNCGKKADEETFCSGCMKHVCEKCDINWDPPWGPHKPSEHLREPDE